jgi:competence protein ComEA
VKPRRPSPPTDETRAEIARRRLAQLAASFDAELPPAEEPERAPVRRTVELRHAKVLATIAVAASVLLVWWLLSGRPETSEPAAPLAFGASTTASAGPSKAPAAELIIDVVGKVRKPGIVTVPKGSRVYQAIEAAGGLKGRVDTAALNMARVLTDGEQIVVGIEPVSAPAGAAAGTPDAAGGKVNLNTATAEQLDTLPGVGPVTAQAILDWREENGRFGSVDDLLDVKGIGDATLAELRDHVSV